MGFDKQPSERDQDSLKNKFDKLANIKKKTGDPTCPEPVRRAKRIARAIQNKCAAMTLGSTSDSDIHEENEVGGSSTGSTGEGVRRPVGTPGKKRNAGATGLPNKAKKTEEVLMDHMGLMAEHIGLISQSIKTATSPPIAPSISRSDVVSIVKEELTESMKPTNELLLKINGMLETLSSKKQE